MKQEVRQKCELVWGQADPGQELLAIRVTFMERIRDKSIRRVQSGLRRPKALSMPRASNIL